MGIAWLIIATLLALAGGGFGWMALKGGSPSRSAFWWMLGVFAAQLMALGWRGDLRGQCPLNDLGEICLFLAWSLTFFYLITGTAYRLSLLGIFTVPLVVVLQGIALIPGALEVAPVKIAAVDPWREAHAAFSVLSYGALALSAIAGLMFLVLNHRLKSHDLKGGLVHGMPSVHRLLTAMGRITLVGWIVLTIGVVSGLRMEGGEMSAHLLVATVTWVLYAVLLSIYFVRGLPGRHFAWSVLILFALSLSVFAKL